MAFKSATYTAIAVVIIVVGSVGGYFVYEGSLQPNIQVTNINITQPNQSPQSNVVFGGGRVANGETFNYVATLVGNYVMTFDNSFSTFSSKSVTLSFGTGGPLNQQSIQVGAGDVQTVQVALSVGQDLNGSFQVSGGSGNDINFEIVGNTCTESVSFSFVLVNSGSANGYSVVSFQSDGNSIWSNRYFVQQGQQTSESGSATLNDCNSHTFNVVVSQVTEA